MDRPSFLTAVAEMLEYEGTLSGSEKLEELEGWDSVALISFMALVDEHFGRKLAPRDIGKCVTVDDLHQLASQNR
jgi:acyl carrier protein